MLILIILLISLGCITAAFAWISHRSGEGGDDHIEVKATCATCNGDNDKCEQECMMEAATKEIEYYDDEELDAYRGRESNHYTDDEAEEFSHVLYTMRQDEVAGWCRSLTLRGISLPDQLKDEIIMMIDDEHI